MILDQLIKDSSESTSPLECLDKFMSSINLSKDQLILQNTDHLKQSIVTINFIISNVQKEYSGRDIRGELLKLNNIEISYLIRFLIQRKSFILDRYKKVAKKEIYNNIRHSINNLVESVEKEMLKEYINKLEYIDLNAQTILGQIQAMSH
jgi:hypothetical protein